MSERAAASSSPVMPSLADGTPWPEDAIEVARIVDAWGIKGGIKLQPFSKDPQALFGTKRWFVLPAQVQGAAVQRPGSRAASAPAPVPSDAEPSVPKISKPCCLKVKTAREQGELVVATVDEIDSRNGAESFKGARVFVSRSAFPTPDEDEYYWIDLIGLNVQNRDGVALGPVVDLLDTGPHCVLRCVLPAEATPDGRPQERLIPFVSAYVDRVSLSDKLIVVDWGLDY